MKTSSANTPIPPRNDSQNARRDDQQAQQHQPLRSQSVDQAAQLTGAGVGDAKLAPPRPRTEQAPRNHEQIKTATSSQQDVRESVAHEEIARRAHELWEQDGRQDGRDREHWTEAEKQLRGSAPFRGPADFERGDAHAEARAIKESAERRANGQTRN